MQHYFTKHWLFLLIIPMAPPVTSFAQVSTTAQQKAGAKSEETIFYSCCLPSLSGKTSVALLA